MFPLKSYRVLMALPVISFGVAFAQPAPKLSSISREWVQRGTVAELILNGDNLRDPKSVIISGAPGVEAELLSVTALNLKIESVAGGITAVAPPESKALKIRLKSDDSAALTDRELRVVTGNGVSNPLTFHLSPLPEIDASGNTSRDRAQNVVLPATISGTISNAAESHFFRFNVAKGQHLILDAHAHRLGSKLDTSLSILDKSGKELARSEDAIGLDSLLDFEVPEDGEYSIELRDFSYQGAGDFKYRLVAGVIPYVKTAFPFGGQRGQTLEVELAGANLENASKILLHLEPNSATGRQELRTATGRGLSNTFPFDVSDLPSFAESEPNSSIDQADRIPVPVAIDGRVNKPRDYDAFKLSAASGQQIVFEVHAFRFGSPLDAVLILTDQFGKTIQRNDDSSGSDARLDYTFKEAGEYVIIIEDLLNRGGDEFRYRLTASIPQPDFSVALMQDVPRVRRAGRVPIRCEVTRLNSFNGTVRIWADALPSGVYADPLILPPEFGSGYLVLNAGPDASLGSFPLTIKASSGKIVRDVSPFMGDRAVKAAFLTVMDSAPFSIAPATLMTSIEQSHEGTIDVLVERRDGFTGEIKVAAEGFSSGREPITRSFEFQPLTIKANENRGTLSLRAKPDSEIVTRHVILRAEAEVAGHPITVFSPLIPVRTIQIPFVLSTSLKKLVVTALPADSSSSASEAAFLVKVDRRMGFGGEIDLKMEGLPEGVNLDSIKIPAGSNETPVKLVATPNAPAGKEYPLTITGSGMHGDRIYRFKAPVVTLAINAPQAEEKEGAKLANTAP